MRVVLDTTFASRAPDSGTGVYIRSLCRELPALGVEVIAQANPRRRPPAGGGLGSARNLLVDLRWSARELPRRASTSGAELIHHPLPALAPLTRAPQVVTVLDLSFERLPEHFHRGFRLYAHLVHRAAARRARAVIAISRTTARDIHELWGVPEKRIVVAPLGPGQALEAGLVRPDPAHFLYIGDGEPRKNLPVLLDAYSRYRAASANPLELVLAGSAKASGAGVRVVDRPSPERLAELLTAASALVHPSLHEGFGLTILEAMGSGVPVLAARSPGVVETCGDAALLADPHDRGDFAAQLGRLASMPELRADLATRGRQRAAEFTWERCARAHVSAYALALGR